MRVFSVLFGLGALLLAACAPVTPSPGQSDGPVAITLTRTVCFGFCPDYSVRIDQDGNVTYEGHRFVAVGGTQHTQIPAADVRALLARFDAIHFNALRDEYRAQVTDLPTTTIQLERNGVRKRVLDYGGTSVGMPESVRELQDEIDRVAGTAQWVLRNGQPVREPGPER